MSKEERERLRARVSKVERGMKIELERLTDRVRYCMSKIERERERGGEREGERERERGRERV